MYQFFKTVAECVKYLQYSIYIYIYILGNSTHYTLFSYNNSSNPILYSHKILIAPKEGDIYDDIKRYGSTNPKKLKKEDIHDWRKRDYWIFIYIYIYIYDDDDTPQNHTKIGNSIQKKATNGTVHNNVMIRPQIARYRHYCRRPLHKNIHNKI